MIAVVTYIKSRSLITAPVEQSAWIEPLFIGPVAFLKSAYGLLTACSFGPGLRGPTKAEAL